MLHTDHLGTPQQITDNTQAVVWKADYDPFGLANITVETITNNLRFPGQYYDEETGLHYNYFRYYDPTLGRYITSDSIGLDGGTNTYSYVMGNPISKYDAFGLYWVFVGWKQEWENNWWTHWRWTIAICKDTCSKETKDVYALYEQWRPIPINTSSPNSPGSGSATDSLFDLIEAIGNAKHYGGIGKGDYYYEKSWKEEGANILRYTELREMEMRKIILIIFINSVIFSFISSLIYTCLSSTYSISSPILGRENVITGIEAASYVINNFGLWSFMQGVIGLSVVLFIGVLLSETSA